jgi:hypothetical protein
MRSGGLAPHRLAVENTASVVSNRRKTVNCCNPETSSLLGIDQRCL